MSAYAAMDDVIKARVEATGSPLLVEWAGAEARFFYLSSDVECFQVSIDPPMKGRVNVTARSVDTVDDIDLEQTWSGPVAGLDGMLESAIAKIEEWKMRP